MLNYLIIFLIFSSSCFAKEVKSISIESSDAKFALDTGKVMPNYNSTICLDYDFVGRIPYIIKVSGKGLFYVSDGQTIFKFDGKGKFLKKTLIPKSILNESLINDFIIGDDQEEEFFLNIDGEIIGIDIESTRPIYNSKGGILIRNDLLGLLYTNFQEYNEKSGNSYDGINVSKKDGSTYKYPSKRDLATLNF